MSITDIYTRRPSRSNYSEKNIEVNDLLEQFLQQIEMVLNTPPSSVLGSPEFGVGLDLYLHEINASESEMINVISRQINNYCSLSGEFSYKINVEFYEVGTSDAAVIDILVEDDNLVRIIVE